TRRDELSDLDLLSGHFAGSGRRDAGVIQLQLGVGGHGACCESTRVRNADTCLGSVYGSTSGSCLTLRRDEICMRDIGRRLRGVELLLGDDLLGSELPGAGEIGVGLVGVGASGSDLRVERSALAGRALYLRLGLSGVATTT